MKNCFEKWETEVVLLGFANASIIKLYIKDYFLQPLLSTLRSTHTHAVWDHCFALQMSEGQCAPGWTRSWWENLLWWWRFVPNEPVHEQVWMSQLRVFNERTAKMKEGKEEMERGIAKDGRWEWIWIPERRQNSDLRRALLGIGSLPSSSSQSSLCLSVCFCIFVLGLSEEWHYNSVEVRMMIQTDIFGVEIVLQHEACNVLFIWEAAHLMLFHTVHSLRKLFVCKQIVNSVWNQQFRLRLLW